MKTDKSGALVRKYCPELKDFPDKVSASITLSLLILPRAWTVVTGTSYSPLTVTNHPAIGRYR